MADDAAVAQFMSVTGASKEDAAFYLGSAGGSVETAVDSFFSTGGGEGVAEADEDMEPEPEPAPAPSAPSAPASGAISACPVLRSIHGIRPRITGTASHAFSHISSSRALLSQCHATPGCRNNTSYSASCVALAPSRSRPQGKPTVPNA